MQQVHQQEKNIKKTLKVLDSQLSVTNLCVHEILLRAVTEKGDN